MLFRSKSENFNEWYPFIVEASDLVDKRYPIKGMDVWRPYGWKTMKLIDSLTHKQMEITEHEEVNFPLLIPENLLEKENALVARLKKAREEGVDPDELRDEEEEGGFKKEVYWVKHAGENELDIPMFLRPTSETAMYTMFPLWIRSHKDLPLKIYQMVNTFRYETKQTRSFIRVREIHFFEAHTAHADEECATRQIAQDLEIVDNLMEQLCLPIIKAKRPVWDTFPGAFYTIGIDAVMPNGRTLQVASCHHYRDQWAKAFDIKYEDENGNPQFCHQTTYGMSERLLGAVVGMHGDDSGLIMPPKIAPIQVNFLGYQGTTGQEGIDYIVADGQIKIVDEFTGRVLEGRRYSDGLHQALEAKENVKIQDENQTLASITYQNYFRMYENLAGMTGTAKTEEEEFVQIYNLEVVEIPTNLPIQRADQQDAVYKTNKAKLDAVIEDIKHRNQNGQPILLGTVSVEASEEISKIGRAHV